MMTSDRTTNYPPAIHLSPFDSEAAVDAYCRVHGLVRITAAEFAEYQALKARNEPAGFPAEALCYSV